ncbi:putative ATP-binding cassette transporter [Flavobacterium sp. 9]|uniref:cyclic peptide export ABC transporter n=1 Tax=Flavobacterium sp. 9 TaxID=2035198 RepID=UPI000C187F9A|nr:cyclic peptide export ABC transporter [Flavobacterium sp. 9]PIF30212.1 putative ATP-binding cassette transporter [Flavobacterium sp. 9]
MLKLKPKEIFYLLLYAIPNTVLSFGIVYIINNILAGKESFLKDYMGIVFVSIIVYSYLLNVIFQKRLNKFSFKLLYDNEKHIFSQILKAPLQRLEKLGSQRFFTAVEDLRTFSFLPYTVTHTVNSLLMLVLCLVYMFTLSTLSALIVIALIVLVAGCYFLVMNSMSKQVAQLRGYNENYYKYVDDVMKGFKELKLSFFRRESLMNNFLIPNRNQSMDLDFKINYIFLSINLISQYGLYFVVAVILFILPEMGLLSRADVISYVVIILFISGPINNIINLQQMYTRFMVANARIKKFIKDFEIVDDTYNSKSGENHDFQSLTFKDITFSYHNESEETASFTSGPINFEIKQGEIIFIVGGNGSGKSTFINLLTGLYKPTGGSMVMNGVEKVDVTEITQSLISAVFTDNHLFSHNYDEYKLENNAEYVELLKTMQLNGIVENDKEESARRRFSKGQSKRMSLIFALLENKPVLVLDEWAADQDPHFRKYFYEQLLPKLKGEGKTIIAVTHDDAYFHLADRIVKFDYGNIVRDLKTTTKEELSENLWV